MDDEKNAELRSVLRHETASSLIQHSVTITQR